MEEITTDAVPNSSELCSFNNIASRTFNETYSSILDKFTIDDYKSMLFLLIDYKINLDDFLYLAKKEKSYLKKKIMDINLNERTFIECLGTMKMYTELKCFGTCYHLFESKKQDFDEIGEIWKTLYTLCEELTDNDLQIIKEVIPNADIFSAEEWFCFAIQYEIIKTTDISQLKDIKVFQKEECLNVINGFRGPKISYYKIRTPTINSPCGIALIFNFEHFYVSYLKERTGSQVDVDCLEHLWRTFGFETYIYNDLTSSDVLEKLQQFSNRDLSWCDVFACCILSHGAPNVIFASDGKAIPIYDELIAIISSCKSLNEKPKLFFIQACQGSNLMMTEGCKEVPKSCDPIGSSRHSLGIDIYAAVATLNGFTSFRSPTTGTWFIQAFCDAMMKYTDNRQYSLSDIMAHVTQDVAKKICPTAAGEEAKQIGPTFSTLQKLLFFKRI